MHGYPPNFSLWLRVQNNKHLITFLTVIAGPAWSRLRRSMREQCGRDEAKKKKISRRRSSGGDGGGMLKKDYQKILEVNYSFHGRRPNQRLGIWYPNTECPKTAGNKKNPSVIVVWPSDIDVRGGLLNRDGICNYYNMKGTKTFPV